MMIVAQVSGCGPSGAAPSALAPPISGASTFLATVTRIEPGDLRDPSLKCTVTLTVDQVISGPSPGTAFWFAIHSPSQDGVKIGRRYKITALKKDNGFEIISRE
jgi:hypothetical protein